MFTETQSLQNNNNQVVNVYVKQVYTCLTQNYELSDNLSIDEMVYQLGINILRDYQFNRNQYELVEVGRHIENINTNAEEADPIINSSTETIRDRYNTNNIAFYIRPFQPNNNNSNIEPVRCIICWINDVSLTPCHENCFHVICADCRNNQLVMRVPIICSICI
jgi:hypothetical protein